MKTHHNQSSNLNPAQSRSAEHRGNRRSQSASSRIDFARRRSNQLMTVDQLLAVLEREAPRFFGLCVVVGHWVWVSFDERQPKRVTALLSQLGFHWAKRRQAWQHPCGHFVDGPSQRDPRETYGIQYPARRA